MYVDPSQYHADHTTQLPPSRTPTPLPVPPPQYSISNVHHTVHSQQTRRNSNPASPHVASYTGQPQDTQDVPMHGYHHQYPTPLLPSSITRTQPPPVPLSQPHQGRLATDDYHYSHAVQPGLGPSYLAHLYPSTPQHPPLHNTRCDPQLPIPLPVPPSQFYLNNQVHHTVHPQPTHRPLNPVSPHVPSCTGKPQVHVLTGSMYGHHSQSPIVSPPQAQPLPVSISQPHEIRSADDHRTHTHAVQPGLARPPLPSALPHCWPAHHPAYQTALPPRFQPHATHLFLSPPKGSSHHVHRGEFENSSAAKRPCYSRSVYVDPHSLQEVSHKASSSLSPAMTKYAQYLRGCYARPPLPENSKFPPSPSVHYINLAYILRRTVSKHESEEFKEAVVRGEIDQIAREKGLDFSHVAVRLPDGSYPQVVLVEGAPGVGKTTFAWEFCKKWGKGELKQEYSLVILLRMRDKRTQEAKCLRDLFYHPEETLPDVIATELISSLCEGVLILLEGLDELPENQRTESSVFLDLIHGRLLPLATVLVTTRPWASDYLHRNCKENISQNVEILGFTKQQIKNYLESVCKSDDDPSLLSDIEKYLSCYPQIHAAMYIPLNVAIVVQVYRRSRTGECIIPKTMTQLYTALSQTLLIRYLKEHPVYKKKKWEIHNFSDLPQDVYEHFLQLSELAYFSIKNGQKLTFSTADLPDSLETLGFMQSVPELYLNESFSHNFLHLTIQEYLAAVYITLQSPEEQLEHFRRYGDGLFKVVMRFVAGLSKFSGIPLDSLRAPFLMPLNPYYPNPQYRLKWDHSVNSNHVIWMFETQDPETINAILGSGNTIDFKLVDLMPFDCYCVGYCIAHSHCQWKLVFYEDITEEYVHMLTAGGSTLCISRQNTSIVSIELRFRLKAYLDEDLLACLFEALPLSIYVDLQEVIGQYCRVGFLKLLNGKLRLLHSLKVVELTMIAVEELRELCKLLVATSNSLEIINIRNIGDAYDPPYVTIEGTYQCTSVSVDIEISSVDDVTSTVSVLRKNSNLGLHITAIIMWQSDNGQVCQLAKALHDTTTLKTLKLFDHPVGREGAMAIAQLIQSNKSLHEVSICGCSTDSEELYHITQVFCETAVRKLNLSYNPIGTKGAMTLAKFIQNNKSLGEVYMRDCNIDSEGACHLAQALCDSTTVRKLDMSFNPIGTKGALSMAKVIHNNNSLEVVYMSNCNVYSEGACYLAQALCENTTLTELNLSLNPIGTKEATVLAELTQNNKSLEEVDISHSSIDSEETCHLAQALCESTTLDLSHSHIGQERSVKESIHKLLEAMTVNSTLQKLVLPWECKEYANGFPRYSEVSSRVGISTQFDESIYIDARVYY